MKNKFYNILIITHNLNINNHLSNFHDYIIINSNYEIIDNYNLKTNDTLISFDYLITDSTFALETLGAMFDNNYVLTNSTFNTSIENVYAFGEIINTNKEIDEQLKIINEAICE